MKRLKRRCVKCFASTRSVQIATQGGGRQGQHHGLCLHTLRADCNRNRPERQPSSNPLPPHAPCRLQPLAASAYSIHSQLCLHTLRADCNLFVRHGVVFRLILCLHTLRADCNKARAQRWNRFVLCLHTLRADCNRRAIQNFHQGRKLCLHTLRADCNETLTMARMKHRALCLHTLRADCNIQRHAIIWRWTTLPPHAPCRLQQHPSCGIRLVETALPPHAPCRLQRPGQKEVMYGLFLCLHTLRADCNGRNAQNCNMHFSERVLSR